MNICNGCSRSRSNALMFKQSFLNDQEANLKDRKNPVDVLYNHCYCLPHILVDCLLRSIWTSFSKGRLRAVMLTDGVSNNRNKITNPQTRNKLSFDGGFLKNVHCCWSEDSSAPPLFFNGRQRLSV